MPQYQNILPPEVRSYQPGDKPALLRIFHLNVPVYFAAEEQADLEEYLSGHGDNYYVVLVNGVISGGSGLKFTPGTAPRISWIFIHPDLHGKNLGTVLLHHCLDKIKEQKNSLTAEAHTSQYGYQFFLKHTFELLEIRSDYWAPGLDLYKMSITF